MKTVFRVAALLLCAVLLLASASCVRDRDPNLPEGMKLATAAGADFRLYIPSAWNANTAYGISGGYYNLDVQSTVSVMKYAVTPEIEALLAEADDGSTRLDLFWQTQCLSAIEDQAITGTVGKEFPAESEATSETAEAVQILQYGDSRYTADADMLDTVNARRYITNATVTGKPLHFLQVVAEKDGAFYVLAFTAHKDLFEPLRNDVEKMIENFVFDEPYDPEEYAKELDADASAPADMKLASNDEVAYRFYVPSDWTVNQNERIYAAVSADGHANVSIVPYSPDATSMRVSEYFDLCVERMIAISGEKSYEKVGEPTIVDLGGRQATAYTYLYTIGGVQYQYTQVIAAYKSMLYSMTYTALPEHFDSHTDDLNAMIKAFAFR